MVHVVFDVSKVTIHDLIGQSGGGIPSYFEGIPFQRGIQRGGGVGDVLRRLWRFVVPLASRAGHAIAPIAREIGKEIGKEGLMAGSRVLSEVAEGANVKEALTSEGRASVNRLLKRAAGQSGGGRSKKRRIIGSDVILKPHALSGRLCSIRGSTSTTRSRQRKVDALGAY